MIRIWKCAACLLFPLALAGSPPSPQQYYAASLSVMRALPQPANLSESVTAVGSGIGVYAGPAKTDARYAVFEGGTDNPVRTVSWNETFDSKSNEATVNTQSANGLIGRSPLFNPTWYAAYDWLRFGLSEPVHDNAPRTASSDSPLKTIASLAVLGPDAYRVTDAGPQRCPNGAAGHHLQFAARTDMVRHPLTDITIEERTLRFCSVSFRLDAQHVQGGTATVQLNYGDVDGYWLETDSHLEIVGRRFGVALARLHIDVSYQATKVQ